MEHRSPLYTIIQGRNISELEELVNHVMTGGYRPHGSMVIDTAYPEGWFYQPMVLNTEGDEE
jgi:hypothetical protein